MKLYLAGPMTGYPDHNYPAFHAAAAWLRSLGYEIANPSENPAPADPTWSGYMRLALAQLLTCDGVATLAGWQESRGASIEVRLAQDLGMTVASAQRWEEFAVVKA